MGESERVVVVGSVVEDRIYRVASLPMPGESALASEVQTASGGKGANQALASRRLGAPTTFVGCVGDDASGRDALAELEAAGVDVRAHVDPDLPTGHAAVVVDETGENLIAVHLGANARLGLPVLEAARAPLTSARVLVTQCECPRETVRAIAELARETDATTILNLAPVLDDAVDLLSGFELVVVNRSEAEQVSGVVIHGLDDAMAALRGIRDLGVPSPVITLGPGGAVFYEHGRAQHARSPRTEAVDSTGAGDAFVGALAAFLAEGEGIGDAVRRACRYASLSVGVLGARSGYVDRTTFEDWERSLDGGRG